MAGIKDYSTTAANNTTIGSISVAEGMLPSNINNAFRGLGAELREWYNDSQWVIYGDGDGSFTIAYASATSFTVSGVDVTSFYHVGRRVKAIATTPGTIFGTISATTFSTNTTVTVTWDSGSLANEAVVIYVAALSKTNDSIPELVITNAKVATSAAIAATKIHDGSVSNTEFGYLDGVTSSIQTQIGTKLTASNNLSDISSASTARTNLGLGTIATQAASNVAVTGGTITGLGSPSSNSDAATKSYVDDAVAGLRTRIVCRAASTANVVIASALENGDILDGITLATGNRVLLKDQTTTSQNGIYTVVASGSASRDTEFDTISELAGQMVIIQEGTSNADKFFLCTTDSSATLGTSSITFTVVTPQNVGTVTSVGLTDSGSSEFTITSSPITSSGNISIAVNGINATKINAGTLPDARLSSAVVTLTGSQTLTNKTLTTPVISSISNTGTLTLPTSTDTLVGLATTDTLTNKTLTAPKIANAGFIADANGNEQIKFTTTASAVNELTVTNSATGNSPDLSATGGDTNIGLSLTTKGTGLIKLNDGAYFPEATLTDGATVTWDVGSSPVAKLTLGGNRTISAPTNGATGQFISIAVIQDATGSRTLTWNSAYEFTGDTAPTLTTTVSKADVFVFRYNGTVWHEMGRNLNLSIT